MPAFLNQRGGGGTGAWPANGGEGVGVGGAGPANRQNEAGSGPLIALNSDNRYNFLPTMETSADENDIISPYLQFNISSLPAITYKSTF